MFSIYTALRLPGNGRVLIQRAAAAQWPLRRQPLHMLRASLRLRAGRVGSGSAAGVPPSAMWRVPRRTKKVIHVGSKGLAHDEVALHEGGLFFRLHQGLRDNLDTSVLFWASKAAMLVSCFALDWTLLRSVLIAESLITMTMHAAWTRPRPARMALCVVFACGHGYSLWLHLRETADYDLGEHEALYHRIFESYGFTKYHFKQMLAVARFRELAPGDFVHQQGDEIKYFPLLVEGECDWQSHTDAAILAAFGTNGTPVPRSGAPASEETRRFGAPIHQLKARFATTCMCMI